MYTNLKETMKNPLFNTLFNLSINGIKYFNNNIFHLGDKKIYK